MVSALETSDPELGPLASLEVVQALCELAPACGPLVEVGTTRVDGPAQSTVAAARDLLRRAALCEPDVALALRIPVAVRHLDAAYRASSS